jgi:hypothetical protein
MQKRVIDWILMSFVALGSVNCNESVQTAADDLTLRASAVINGRFGMHCQDSYQNNWLATFTGGFTMCDRLGTTLSATATQHFYFNLAGKQFYWHETGDHAAASVEDVDLFFGNPHGGAWQSTYAEYGMWDQNVLATTNNMRLGDEARNTSIFATYSCKTLQTDANMWTRWDSVFAGGLRMSLGSHDTVWFGPAYQDSAKVFAQYLNAGWSVKDSWYYGLSSPAGSDTDIAVMTTGSNSGDCSARLSNMTWGNFSSYGQLRDGAIGWYCWWKWDDV